MSSAKLLNTPKVDREVVSRSPGVFSRFKDGDTFQQENFARQRGSYPLKDYFFFPFSSPAHHPGWLSTVHVGLMVFLGCLLNGWFSLQPLNNAITAMTDPFLTALVIGILQGSMFFLASYWTFEEHLPTLVYPEITLASVGTSRLGAVVVLGYLIIQYAAYALAGYFLRLSNGGWAGPAFTGPAGLTNVATTGASYAFYWFGATVITFNWIYNYEFVMRSERFRPFKVHFRAALCTGIAIAVLVLAFWTFGLRVFSSGMYITTWVFRNTDAAGGYTASWVPAPWAFYWFGGLFGGAAAAWILYIIVNIFVSWRAKGDTSEAYEDIYGIRAGRQPVEKAGSDIPYTPMANNATTTKRGLNKEALKESLHFGD